MALDDRPARFDRNLKHPAARSGPSTLSLMREELVEAVWVASILGTLLVASVGLGAILALVFE